MGEVPEKRASLPNVGITFAINCPNSLKDNDVLLIPSILRRSFTLLKLVMAVTSLKSQDS